MIALLATFLSTKTALGPKAAEWIARSAFLALAALALWLAYCWAYNRGAADERAKWEAAAEHLEDADAAADAEAIDVAHDAQKDIDDANERAKQAAAGSGDPLAAGLDSLRKEGAGGSGKAPR